MSTLLDFNKADLVSYAVDIVTAYVSNNNVSSSELPQVIVSVHAALADALAPAPAEAPRQAPVVPIRKSITPDYLISLEDGRRYKSLKRHLGGRGLSPAEYRAKWGLPVDYPMVAPNYAKARSELAKASGLGRRKASRASARPVSKRKPGRRKAA